ncbi:MAG: FmdB family zinc ribbon protein [Verrucomicrobiota bacterium]
MPTYDYKCETCGHQFEVFQSMNDERLTDCPEDNCDGSVKRLLGTGAGIIFKGSGFYETDYRSDSYKKAESADKSSGDSGSSEKKSSSESKTSGTASKSETKKTTTPSKSDG